MRRLLLRLLKRLYVYYEYCPGYITIAITIATTATTPGITIQLYYQFSIAGWELVAKNLKENGKGKALHIVACLLVVDGVLQQFPAVLFLALEVVLLQLPSVAVSCQNALESGKWFVGGIPPLQWSRRFDVCRPLLQWSTALLAAARLYNGPPFGSRSSSVVSRFDGGFPPMQWSPALLAASRLYFGAPLCLRPPTGGVVACVCYSSGN